MTRFEITDNTAQTKNLFVGNDWNTRLVHACHDEYKVVHTFATNLTKEAAVFGQGINSGTQESLHSEIKHQPGLVAAEIATSASISATASFIGARFPTAAKPAIILGAGAIAWSHVDPSHGQNRERFIEIGSIWHDTWGADKKTMDLNVKRAARALGSEWASFVQDATGVLIGHAVGVETNCAVRGAEERGIIISSLRDNGKTLRLISSGTLVSTDKILNRLRTMEVMHGIKDVDLGFTELNGTGLKSLTHLQNLESVTLPLSQKLPADSLGCLQHIRHLKSLDMGGSVSDEALHAISGAKGLTHLSAGFAEDVTDTGLKHLSKLTNLEQLHIANASEITARGLSKIGDNLSHLETLSLRQISITDAGATHISKLKNLTTLDISNCKVTDKGMERLTNLTSLQTLMAHTNGFTDKALQHVAKFSRLQNLYVGGNTITDAGVKNLRQLKNLEHLSLRDTNVSDEGITSLNSLKKLSSLNIEKTGVSDASLPTLKKIDFVAADSSRISRAGLEQLRH